jgi:hypothetical protein
VINIPLVQGTLGDPIATYSPVHPEQAQQIEASQVWWSSTRNNRLLGSLVLQNGAASSASGVVLAIAEGKCENRGKIEYRRLSFSTSVAPNSVVGIKFLFPIEFTPTFMCIDVVDIVYFEPRESPPTSVEESLSLDCKGNASQIPSEKNLDPSGVFSIKVDLNSGKVSGAFADIISGSKNFSPKVNNMEISASGDGLVEFLGWNLLPSSYYSLSRSTGKFSLSAIAFIPQQKLTVEFKAAGLCEVAKQKF